MLAATSDLQSCLGAQDFSPYAEDVEEAVDRIVRAGDATDLAALTPWLDGDADQIAALLPIVMAHGTRDHARALSERWLGRDGLVPDAPEQVLHALGYLHWEPAIPLLLQLARGDDHGIAVSACLGLLNLDCREHRDEIRREILRCRGCNLFPELYPALASQTGDTDLPAFLFELGETSASTDCNGGLLLGLALLGEAGAALFEEALFSPHWEAGASATGSRRWSYWGMRYLGWSGERLLARLRETVAHPTPDPARVEAAFEIVTGLLEMARLNPPAFLRGVPPDPPDFSALTDDGTVLALAREHVPDSPWLEELERLLA